MYEAEYEETCLSLEDFPSSATFGDVQNNLVEAISSVEVELVNMSGGALDYENIKILDDMWWP